MPDQVTTAAEPVQPHGDPFWTIANVFSLLRMALVPPTLWALHQGDDGKALMVGLVLTMILSDWLDGFLARRLGSTSRWGHILDPVADKVALNAIALTLVALKGLPLWVPAVLIGRDILIVLAGVFLLAKERIVQPSNIWGKATSLSMALLLLSYAVDFEPAATPLLALTGALIGVSTLSYGWWFLHREPQS